MMTVTEYLESTFDADSEYITRKRIICTDGFSLSVQGGTEYHYCSPRERCNEYCRVEIGFPSAPVPEFAEWKEGGDAVADTDTVFGYVPIDVVESVVASHGGIQE